MLASKASILWSSESEHSIRSQSQRLSLEDEKERIEAELKRLNQPEVRREWQLLDDLQRSEQKYYRDRSESSRKRCESLMEQVLALPKPSAKAYSACATTANMLSLHHQAIAILRKAIAEYPDEHVLGPILPLKISGNYRIGAIATCIGDANEATRAYETIIGQLNDIEGPQCDKAQCYIYLADIASEIIGDKRLATERLREVVRIMDSTDIKEVRDDELFALELLKDWATFEIARLQGQTLTYDTNLIKKGSGRSA